MKKPGITGVLGYNRSRAGRCTTTSRPLTHSLVLARKGLPAMVPKICSIPECGLPHKGRGYCSIHHRRKLRDGTISARPRLTTEQRFWPKVDKNGPIPEKFPELGRCWIWTGALDDNGYGKFAINRTVQYTHRLAWELAFGESPKGMKVDHRCHNTSCVNTKHLRLATVKQNQEHRAGPTRFSTSGILGVGWDKSRGKWRAQVAHNGENMFLGRFDTKEEAEAAALSKRRELFTHNDHDRIAA